MITEDFIIELFCRIADQMRNVAHHSQAELFASELVTVGVLFALQSVGGRPSIAAWVAIMAFGFLDCPSVPDCSDV